MGLGRCRNSVTSRERNVQSHCGFAVRRARHLWTSEQQSEADTQDLWGGGQDRQQLQGSQSRGSPRVSGEACHMPLGVRTSST